MKDTISSMNKTKNIIIITFVIQRYFSFLIDDSDLKFQFHVDKKFEFRKVFFFQFLVRRKFLNFFFFLDQELILTIQLHVLPKLIF